MRLCSSATPLLSWVFLQILPLFKNVSKDFTILTLLSLYILDTADTE